MPFTEHRASGTRQAFCGTKPFNPAPPGAIRMVAQPSKGQGRPTQSHPDGVSLNQETFSTLDSRDGNRHYHLPPP